MPDPFSARQQMIELQLRARGVSDPRVLAAMASVPRDRFVSSEFLSQAYDDNPLPIGEGQTISQPYIVAIMLELLRLEPTDKVLEVGAGSGYATALLAELAAQVFSLERRPALADNACRVLATLGYTNAKVFTGDGIHGFPEAAPFNAILVSAAASAVPTALVDQLANAGRMVIPVGDEGSQQMQLIRKIDGQPVISPQEMVRFVPLIHDPL
jgi:protein-L-isoaspartate(D-aspartate) O-methyltransferase